MNGQIYDNDTFFPNIEGLVLNILLHEMLIKNVLCFYWKLFLTKAMTYAYKMAFIHQYKTTGIG